MTRRKKVLVAGAGIGGVCVAALLAKARHEVVVFEQAPVLGEVGAGIQLSANGVKVLQHLGLSDALEKFGVRPEQYVFRLYNSGEILQSFRLADEHQRRNGAPYYQVHRADIHGALVEALDKNAPGCVRLNAQVTSFQEQGGGISIKLADGRSEEGDLVIGADGVKSAVRRQILGDTPARFTGQSAWRMVIPASRLPAGFMEKVMTVWVGPGKHAVMYYLRGGELVNFVGCVDSPDWTDDSWTVRAPWEDLRADFAEGWHDDVLTFIDAAERDECFRWGLYNRPPVEHWSLGRATLLGDACHATLPYMAQGAVMAIEDGAVLLRSLDREDEVSSALQLYQRNRIPRTAKIVNESSDNAQLFHLPTELALRAAFASRNIGAERNDWLFSYDALSIELE